MKTVSLDVHSDASQLYAVNDQGEVILEMRVPTEAGVLRQIIGGIPGRKRVVFEEGPLSGLLRDALSEVAEEVVSCDPTHNALIARNENSNDRDDAIGLSTLARMGELRPVYVPPEPYRTLRGLLMHDWHLHQDIVRAKCRIKALCRQHGIRYGRENIYAPARRDGVLAQLDRPARVWQMRSLYRQLDLGIRERGAGRRTVSRLVREMPEVKRLQGAPGVGPQTARTLVAWIVDPGRFKSRNALAAYCGLGLGRGWTNWKPVGRTRASKRGQRQLKRLLFIAAKAASHGSSALARRYHARQASGWDHSKAIRDVARTLLRVVCVMWTKHTEYCDDRVSVPQRTGA